MTRIPNDKESFMAIPLWNFFITSETQRFTYESSLLTIDALGRFPIQSGLGVLEEESG